MCGWSKVPIIVGLPALTSFATFPHCWRYWDRYRLAERTRSLEVITRKPKLAQGQTKRRCFNSPSTDGQHRTSAAARGGHHGFLHQIGSSSSSSTRSRSPRPMPQGSPCTGRAGLSRPITSLGACAPSMDPTTTSFPARSSGAPPGTQFPTLVDPTYRPADGTMFDPDGPGGAPPMPTSPNYNPSNNPNSLVFDSSLRTISNLLVDQTLGNPAAILTALERAGSANPMADLPAVTAIYQAFKPAFDAEYQARVVMQNAKAAADALGDGDPATPPSAEEQAALDALANATAAHAATVLTLEAAREVRDTALEPFGDRHGRRQRPSPRHRPGRGPFGAVQLLVHAVRPVLRSRSRPRRTRAAAAPSSFRCSRTTRSTSPGSHTNFMVLTRATTTRRARWPR